ncbi:MAG TPA: DNA-directed RNA polymerase subunit omega [Candidatus Polarisedimenticolaceae bacterium]|nr:DNA-directed RNA polymerase subunit omega [Candidatus Polarisedimenticolaceae bacterium]
MFKIPESFGSKYRFVMLAALRAEQLQQGALPRVETVSHKPTVMAQEEVAAGVVEAWDGSEPAQPETPAESEG